MREARTPNTHERNKRFGYVAIAMFILTIMMLSGIVKSTSVKASNEEVSTTYKVGDILKVDSDGWNIRTEPSINADIAYEALYGEQFEILSVEENNWYRLNSYLGEYYIQIVPECMDYLRLFKKSVFSIYKNNDFCIKFQNINFTFQIQKNG